MAYFGQSGIQADVEYRIQEYIRDQIAKTWMELEENILYAIRNYVRKELEPIQELLDLPLTGSRRPISTYRWYGGDFFK